MSRSEELSARAAQVQLANYRPSLVLVEGRGCEVRDADGRSYLDLSAGIAVTSLGHAHPRLARAVARQAERLWHVSNLFYNDRAIELAEAWTSRTAFDRVFFCNSGTEANEALLKLARHYHFGRGDVERVEIVSTMRSFHGRTMGALALTGQPKYHEGMGPMLAGVRHVPFDDLEAMRAAVGPQTAAVIVEPVQAEGGLYVPADDYLAGLREICDAAGALLLFDEVQTGCGRLGRWLGAEHWGVVADACSLAKGIAGGFPLGAMLVREHVAGALPPGTHASTFGGNPLACAAGLEVLSVVEDDAVLDNVQARGEQLRAGLSALAQRHPCVAEVRGLGLLQGAVLSPGVDPGAVLQRLREAGILATLAGGNVLRISPALTVTAGELERGLEALDAAFARHDAEVAR